MSHLDDTAIVAIDIGEFGTDFSTISDDLISHSKWKNMEDKNKTIDKVITEHNYLKSAYTILPQIAPKPKYYPYIRKMVYQNKYFEDIEYAIYALAKYKKKEDVKLIKDILLTHSWEMGYFSFKLMQEYPNNTYLEVLDKFSKKNLYRRICQGTDLNDIVYFFDAVASYKQPKSAEILFTILNRNPFLPCTNDSNFLKEELIYSLWNNQCEAYSRLIYQIKPKIVEYEKHTLTFPNTESIDTSKTIRW